MAVRCPTPKIFIAAAGLCVLLFGGATPSHAETEYQKQRRQEAWCVNNFGFDASPKDHPVCRIMDLIRSCSEGRKLMEAAKTAEQRRVALVKCNTAAQGGFLTAGVNMGIYYNNGVPGVIKADQHVARTWHKWAASQGHPAGQRQLGHMYLLGEGGPANFSKGKRLIVQSARNGDAVGQVILAGMMHSKVISNGYWREGSYRSADIEAMAEALFWACRAASSDHRTGQPRGRKLCSSFYKSAPQVVRDRFKQWQEAAQQKKP